MSSSDRETSPLQPRHAEGSGQGVDVHRARLLVDFLLDEESSPMQLAMYYDLDGPNELETILGMFRTKEDAMLALGEAKHILERPRGYARVREAFREAQRAALQCPGNLGLPAPTPKPERIEQLRVSVPTSQKRRTHLAAQVLASPQFSDQRKRAHRVTLSDKKVGALLRKLIAAPHNRIDSLAAATALGVPPVLINGALPMAQRLLNVEQFPVLTRDPDGSTVVLDVALMKEQFGVSE